MLKVNKKDLNSAIEKGIISKKQSDELYQHFEEINKKNGLNVLTIFGIIIAIIAYIGLFSLSLLSESPLIIVLMSLISIVVFYKYSKILLNKKYYASGSFFDSFYMLLSLFLIYYLSIIYLEINEHILNVINIIFVIVSFYKYKKSNYTIHFSQIYIFILMTINYGLLTTIKTTEMNIISINVIFLIISFSTSIWLWMKDKMQEKTFKALNIMNSIYSFILVISWLLEKSYKTDDYFLLIFSILSIGLSFVLQTRMYLLSGIIYFCIFTFSTLTDANVEGSIIVLFYLILSVLFVYLSNKIIALERKTKHILFKD